MSSAPVKSLRALTLGESIRVVTAEDGVLLGRFERVEGSTLIMAVAGDTDAEVPLDAIVRVARVRYLTRQGATIGALVGGLPPLVLAQGKGLFTLALLIAAVLAAAFAAIGALIGAFADSGRIVYDAAR